MKKLLRNKKAITLIALVITIVVLVILASVIITLSLGENGLMNRALKAAKGYSNAQDKEKQDVNDLYSQMLIAANDDAKITLSVKELEDLIDERIESKFKNVGEVISFGNGTPKECKDLNTSGNTKVLFDSLNLTPGTYIFIVQMGTNGTGTQVSGNISPQVVGTKATTSVSAAKSTLYESSWKMSSSTFFVNVKEDDTISIYALSYGQNTNAYISGSYMKII